MASDAGATPGVLPFGGAGPQRHHGNGHAHQDAGRADERGGPGPLIQAAIDAAILEVGPDADESLIMAAVNRRLARVRDKWNETAQEDFGGLSPVQVRRLLQRSDWVAGDGAIQLRTSLTLPDLAYAPTFANARALLALAAEPSGLAATDAGNLKLAVVDDLLERLQFEDGYVADLRSVSKRITEQDVGRLHQVRVLAGVAGLLRRKGPRFEATKVANRLLDDARAGQLYARLFETCFVRFNLAYGRPLEWPELQHQIGYTLYRLGRAARDWRHADALVELVVLPFASEQAPRLAAIDARAAILENQVLERLVGFGLLDRKPQPPERALTDARAYRVTRLYDAFLHFDL